MNKLFVSVIFLAALVFGFNVVSNEYRVEFRDWALSMEAEKGGLQARTVEVNGTHMALYENTAQGTPIVMLHGFSGNKTNWLRLAQSLNGAYKLIIPDLKGHGDNPQDLDGDYRVSAQVDYLNALMGVLGVDKFHLVGNSMGGAISAVYAARHPQQVESLILISPAGVHEVPSEMDKLLETGKNPLIATNEEEFYQVIDFVMSEPPFIPSAIARAEAEVSVSRTAINKKIFTDIRSDLVEGSEKEFANISVPTLFIWGADDRAINVENIEPYSKLIAGSEKAVLDGIGHLAMIEVPDYTAELITEFIEK